ncbi:MAG TPA: hypothetical protein VK850_04635, partial [Candidatus Binatia bacterium]|nr:hypothetical protein [Candidatus Binatia bacterium]
LLLALHRHRENTASHHRASWVRVRVRARAVVKTFRRNVVAENLSVSDSALRRRQARVRMSVVARNSDRNRQFASQ